MAQSFKQVSNPPDKPLLLWDGQCEFCRYWIIRLKKITKNALDYAPFQKQSAQFPEIPASDFRKAVTLIDVSGNIYSGAAAVFKTLQYSERWPFLFRLYLRSILFRNGSELMYKKIAKNRPLAYNATIALWGKNPASPKYYWLLYIAMLLIIAKLIRHKKNKHK